MQELKPCPFCGGEEVYVEEYEHHHGAMRWRVLCVGCMAGVDTGTRQSAGEAVQDWNRRAERTCHPVCSVHEDVQPIDRDALLALADEMETDGTDCYTVSTQYVLDDYARRIREACGEGER